ncbi:MAG: hypothetical protein KJ787_03065 [Gammaproteobacteria bacterium]|nr:hypothetical protein [Gammaproteobacteria bacterium]MBU1645294.1 hypothetical protein [Gammaproteobacteria bacterium]MBU1971631.1 hypothetical protein [Gammaproteobacteria bacterium]
MLSFEEIEDCFPDNTGTDNVGRMRCTAQWLHDFAHAIAAKEREACADVARRWGETHEPGITVNARNAGRKIADGIMLRSKADVTGLAPAQEVTK